MTVLAPEPEITARRELAVERLAGIVTWRVTEFSNGNVMLIARSASTEFSAHFDAEQWAAFQGLVAG